MKGSRSTKGQGQGIIYQRHKVLHQVNKPDKITVKV